MSPKAVDDLRTALTFNRALRARNFMPKYFHIFRHDPYASRPILHRFSVFKQLFFFYGSRDRASCPVSLDCTFVRRPYAGLPSF